VVLIATGHNNRTDVPATFLAGIDSFVIAPQRVYPGALPLIASQNPKFAPAAYVEPHLARQTELRSYAIRKGYGYVPILEAFLARPDKGVSSVDRGGVHPTTGGAAGTGARVWADTFQAHLDALSVAPRT
jgi:hypothetical protein